VVSLCCGGGGYGEPDARDPAQVAKGVAEGWISAQRARDVYRVALDEDGQPDPRKTRELRASGAGQGGT